MTQAKLSDWFQERPNWFRDAARRLLEYTTLSDQDYEDLKKICLEEVDNSSKTTEYALPENAFDSINTYKLKLTSIGEVQGINALSPKVPLRFGQSNLAVIYGQNGTGKSGYVRILKHACGMRNPGNLLPNAYSTKTVQQNCAIDYEKDDIAINVEWDASSGLLPDLACVDIFDTSCGKVYVTAENEVTYEPPVLSFFSDLIKVCEDVSGKLDLEIEKHISKLPTLPSAYATTLTDQWYQKLSVKTKKEDIEKNCSWSDEDEENLIKLQKRLAEKAPKEQAQLTRKKQQHIKTLIADTKKHLAELSDEDCKRILSEKKKAAEAKETAEVAAKKVFSSTPLTGIGSETWKNLWEFARNYSETEAYTGQTFPYVEEESRCVLCHQPLSDEAKTRMVSFEDFIKGAAQNGAKVAQDKFEKSLDTLSEIPTIENIRIKTDAGGISQKKIIPLIEQAYSALQSRKTSLNQIENYSELDALPDCDEWLTAIQKHIDEYERIAQQYDQDAESDNRPELKSQFSELQARKWLSQQRTAIDDELKRLASVKKIQLAKKLAQTRALSTKKGELAETLITDAYVERFNSELKYLRASHVNVELIKSKVKKGKVLHKLRLQDSNISSPGDVLSEGEYRIVALAAFLADVTGKIQPAPFVFDDPISSLDQPFEEAVVQRLVALSKERQVIVLTHRLSLLGMVQDYAKKAGLKPEVVCLRKESWGAGEPGGAPLFARKPEGALKALIAKLPNLRKMQEKHGQEVYDPQAKALCSDFRIIVERMVECNLLADVVQRYRRAINTMGKIEHLAKIEKSDCKFIDDLMTEYSRYEHAQPIEAPVPMPSPDDLERDFKSLQSWHDEFKKRPTP